MSPDSRPVSTSTRLRAALSRWWAFARGAYAGRVAAAASRARNHRFFPHPAEPAPAAPAPSPVPRGVTARKG
jgi:hypothetical protein